MGTPVTAYPLFYTHFFMIRTMKKDEKKGERPRRRFCEAVDGPLVRRWYAVMPTRELARRLGLTVKQIENYVYRRNSEPWARKCAAVVAEINSRKGKKGGRPRKNGKLKS